jgi:hypothetical protein
VRNKARLVAQGFSQVYVDDIIFGGSSHTVMSDFQKMIEQFQMSMMGELTFFLGIQVK